MGVLLEVLIRGVPGVDSHGVQLLGAAASIGKASFTAQAVQLQRRTIVYESPVQPRDIADFLGTLQMRVVRPPRPPCLRRKGTTPTT